MLIRAVIFIILFTIMATSFAASSSKALMAKPCQSTKSGKLKIVPNKDELNTKTISFTIHDNKISGQLCLYHANVYDDHSYKDVVKGEFLMDNISEHKTQIQYHVILKDKKGLLAKTTGHIHLRSGLKQLVHFSSIPLPVKDIKNITSYEIKFTTKNLIGSL